MIGLNTNTNNENNYISKLMKDVLESWPWYFTSIFATVAYLLMDFYMRKMVGVVADDIIYRNDTFLKSLLLLLAAAFFASPFHGLSTYTKGYMAEEVLLKLRLAIGRKTKKLSMHYLETHESAEIISHLGTELNTLNRFTYYGLSMVTTLFVQLIGVTAFMLSVDFQITVLFISMSLLVLPISVLMTKQVRKNEKEYLERLAKSQQCAREGIHFITMIKSYLLEDRMFSRYKEAMDKTTDSAVKNENRIAYVTSAGMAIGFIPFTAMIALGVYRISEGTLTQGELLSLLTIGGGFFSWLQGTPDVVAYLKKAQVACERIYSFLDTPEEENGMETECRKKDSVVVKLNEVYFAYPGEKNILNGVSLEIREGESVALVGASGSGKTTLIKLICGLMKPTGGSIEVFGNLLEEWDKAAMRQNISLVGQVNNLFPGNLRDNLLVDQKDIKDEELIHLCRQAGLETLIAERGLDGEVGEAGYQFSGGEKQRIHILRALLSNAKLILMDEPTSALDAVSEEAVQTCLDMLTKEKTTLTIAHRMHTIQNAGRIYVLHQGKIVQCGSHEELINQEGRYREMLQYQELKGGDQLCRQ